MSLSPRCIQKGAQASVERKIHLSRLWTWGTFLGLFGLAIVVPATAWATRIIEVTLASPDGGSDALAAVVSFYQSLLTVAGIGFAVVAALAYLSIRAATREHVERLIKDEVKRYFKTDKEFDSAVSKLIAQQTEEHIAGLHFLHEVGWLRKRYDSLQGQIYDLQRNSKNSGDEIVE